MSGYTIHHGDCVEVLDRLPEASIDAIVCDPPYGLEFMGKEWDRLDGGGTVLDDPAEVGGFQDGAGGNPYSRSRIRYGDGAGVTGARAMQAWHERWAAAALRVLKPGGFLLAFSGTRTYHRLACAIEDAGFEVRDMIDWLYGSGFPKSLDVAKAIDSRLGVEGEYGGPKSAGWIERGQMRASADTTDGHPGWRSPWEDDPEAVNRAAREYHPASPEGKEWNGWGTALKPGHEPIVVARKPLAGTVADNVLTYGTGALNIDASRIGMTAEDRAVYESNFAAARDGSDPDTFTRDADEFLGTVGAGRAPRSGRYPANVILSHDPACEQVGWREVRTGTAVNRNRPEGGSPRDSAVPIHAGVLPGPDVSYGVDGREMIPEWACVPGCPVAELDRQSGESSSSSHIRHNVVTIGGAAAYSGGRAQNTGSPADAGGASRFFYVTKASTAERNRGLAEFPEQERADASTWCSRCTLCGQRTRAGIPGDCGHDPAPREWVTPPPTRNVHPTVKPVDLMRHLVRMVTPPGGTVLDPFLGSGTTGIACVLEGFGFVGIEREAEYVAIAEARIEHARLAPRAWEPGAPPPPKVRTKGDGWEQEAML